MPGAGSRAGEKEQPAGVSLLRVHRTAGEKAVRSPAQETFNDLRDCAREGAASQGYPTGRRREEAGEAPSAHQPQGEGRAKRVSRSASGSEGAGVPGLVPGSVRHLLGNGDNRVLHRIETDAGGAELDPEIPHHAAGGRLSLVVRRRESRARSQANGPGRGWTLQFSGLETLEKARQRSQLFTNQ